MSAAGVGSGSQKFQIIFSPKKYIIDTFKSFVFFEQSSPYFSDTLDALTLDQLRNIHLALLIILDPRHKFDPRNPIFSQVNDAIALLSLECINYQTFRDFFEKSEYGKDIFVEPEFFKDLSKNIALYYPDEIEPRLRTKMEAKASVAKKLQQNAGEKNPEPILAPRPAITVKFDQRKAKKAPQSVQPSGSHQRSVRNASKKKK